MIKKTITYDDFDGNPVSEDHYFHLSKAEILGMESEVPGGLAAKLQEITDSTNGAEIIATFKWIIERSYGQRVDNDPRRFHKSDKISQEFLGSLAFDAFFDELIMDENLAMEFVYGVIPKNLAQQAQGMSLGRQEVTDVPLPPRDDSKVITDPKEVVDYLSKSVVPDPNKIDGPDSTWPRNEEPNAMTATPQMRAALKQRTGLENPWDDGGNLLPWVNRDPTSKETMEMNTVQLQDVYRRKNHGWTPTAP